MARVAQVATRRTYNDLDRWRVYNDYISNGGYTKTAAKRCHIAVSTVRSWVKTWDFDPENPLNARNPPESPTGQELEQMAETEAGLVDQYCMLRGAALRRLEEVIPKTNSADQLIRVVKELNTHIDRANGLHDSPSTVNVNLRLAEARQGGEALIEGIKSMLGSAHARQAHITHEVDPLEIASTSDDGGTDENG